MYRFLLAPRWLAFDVAVVAAVVACVLLGSWQLTQYDRAGQVRANNQAAAPVDLTALLRPGTNLDGRVAGRTVSVSGRYDEAQQLLVPGRRLGDREGFVVVTPLITSLGAVVTVNRGWVPSGSDAALAVPTGDVTVTGVLQPAENTGDSGVDAFAALPNDQLAFIAGSELVGRWPYPPQQLYDGFVVLASQQPTAAAAPTPVPARLAPPGGVGRWRNFAYGVQWWIFGAAALFFWGSAVRAAVRDRRSMRA